MRLNPRYYPRQWEVVHNWGGLVMVDDKMKIVSRHVTESAAERAAKRLEDTARGEAVLKAIAKKVG